MKKLIIVGAGGFAKSVIDSLDSSIYEIAGFIDAYKTGEHQGYKIISNSIKNIKDREQYYYFIAVGEPRIRKEYYLELKSYNLKLINIIDTSSILARNIVLGEGIYIGKLVIVNSDTIIKDNVVLNTKALIEHGNTIEMHSNISTNTTLNGDIRVGEATFIGSCSVVNGQIKIGSNVIVGSGSVVIKDIEDNLVVAGAPVKVIRRNL